MLTPKQLAIREASQRFDRAIRRFEDARMAGRYTELDTLAEQAEAILDDYHALVARTTSS